jgi:thioredoxin reductase (NADPH)
VLVVGGGIAGLTAGLFAARCGRTTVVVIPLAAGGAMLTVERIEDFPGFPDGVAGFELAPTVQEQAEAAGALPRFGELERLEPRDGSWLAVCGAEHYVARSVVLATGTRARAAGIAGEERFAGRGVSHCASCDGPLQRGRVVAVVGGGDSALQEALTLAEHAAKVVVLHRGPALRAQETYRSRVASHPAIDVRLDTGVEEIVGDDRVAAVRVREHATGTSEEIPVDALFVYAGLEAVTAPVAGLVELDGEGRIVTDATLATAAPGLYAAGDVRSGSSGQAVAAAGDGAAAAMAAHRYLAAVDNSAALGAARA